MDQAHLQSLINAILTSSDPTWVEVTQMIFSGMGIAAIIIGYLQLIALNKQMKSTIDSHNELMRWNKSAMQNQILYEAPSIEIELSVADILKNNDIKSYEIIPEEKCEIIFSDPKM